MSVKYVILTLFFTVLILAVSIWYVMTRYFPDLVTGSSEPSKQSSVSVSQSQSEPPSSPSSVPEDKTIPTFVGRKADEVSTDPKYENRFKFELRYNYDDGFAEGIVYEQAPPAGEIMQNKGTVILYVSKGKLQIAMPDLAGKTVGEATEILNALGKEYDVDYISFQFIEQYDAETLGGTIIKSVPAADMLFYPKTTPVIIYVALQVEVGETKEIETSGRRPVTTQPRASDD